MRKQVKIWWSELADQYEEWADDPPMFPGGMQERYTCSALRSQFGDWDTVVIDMGRVWLGEYDDVVYPIAHTGERGRDEQRYWFCMYMAETIREAIGEE